MENIFQDIKNNPKFEIFYQELISYNNKVNLTRITDKNEVYIKHFYDSVIPIDEIPKNSKVIDVGSGAGFPLIPLKILRNDINITLLDSVNKKVDFLKYISNMLNIQSVCIHSRVEDYAKKNFESFDVVVSRAVSLLPTLLEYCAPLVKIGGKIIAYKSTNYVEELNMSKKALEVFNLKLIKKIESNLPQNLGNRVILIFEKINHCSKKYPRGKNLPRLSPII